MNNASNLDKGISPIGYLIFFTILIVLPNFF